MELVALGVCGWLTFALLDRRRKFLRSQQVRSQWAQLSAAGQMPVVVVPLLLARSEQCHCAVQAQLLSYRQPEVRYYRGLSMNIPIVRGLRYRFGSVRSTNEPVLSPVESGTLFVTSERIMFRGRRENREISLRRLTDISVEARLLRMGPRSGSSLVVRVDTPDVIAGLIRTARSRIP